MSGILRLSARAYAGLLLLYPPELCRDFGPEIRELFSEDLDEAWQSRGAAGVLRVWWCTICEFLRIALPALTSNPMFAVPAFSFAFDIVVLSFQLAAANSHHPLAEPYGLRLWQEFILYVVLPGIVTGLTALTVVHTGKVGVLSLQLSIVDEAPCLKSAI